MNNRGSLADIFIWMAIGFAVLVFFGIWTYSHHLLTTTLEGIETGDANINISDATYQTLGKVDDNMYWLHILAFAMIFSMVLTMLISNFYIKSHPVAFVIYVFVAVVAIIASVYISNSYETFLSDSTFGSTMQEFTAGTYIMLNLPLWTAIISIFGTILLLAGILRDTGAGGSVI